MIRELNAITPNKVLSFLEGGYFPTNYVESAAMEVKGLLGERLPNVEHPRRVSPGLVETIWNNVIHHSTQFKCMQETLDQLQRQQARHGLPPYVLPPKLHLGLGRRPLVVVKLGLGVRDLWEKVKQLKAVRTREWFPEMAPDLTDLCNQKIAEYIKVVLFILV